MANGGRRPGAGRPKGSPNVATKEREARVAASGKTPIEMLLRAARWHYDRAEAEIAKGAKCASNLVREEFAAMSEHAVRVAQFVHPKYAAITPSPTVFNLDNLNDDEARQLQRLLRKCAPAGYVTAAGSEPEQTQR